MPKTDKILVIGAGGQIGVDLVMELRSQYGSDNVIASDIRESDPEGPFEVLDVMDKDRLFEVTRKHGITHVYHLAAILSATAEKNPALAWDLNMTGLFNVLELAKEKHISKLFWPSSIAVFGPTTPQQNTPQTTIMEPTSIYGISKLAGERWCEYYRSKYDVDVRGVRYPGLIGWRSQPGGGTTDYAVDIFHHALKEGKYTCFLSSDRRLPMMYMPDAIRATITLVEAHHENMQTKASYNIAAFNFTPAELATEIKSHLSDFQITYYIDDRDELARMWPESIDDRVARDEWGWRPDYNLSTLVEDMIANLRTTRVSV